MVWALWHYPAILFSDYRSHAPLWFQLPVFTTSVLGMSFFTARLRLKSGGLWPAVLWHGNHNLLIQGLFLNMTQDTDITEYIVDDFGVGLSLATLALGYLFGRKRTVEMAN
jgi:membrane protease YdiL (CAAX protease family)